MDVIPDEFTPLLPTKPDIKHKFADVNTDYKLQAKCAKALIESIKNKDGVDMMLASLDPLPDGAMDGMCHVSQYYCLTVTSYVLVLSPGE